MLLISQNLAKYDMSFPEEAIFRVNLAWVNNIQELTDTLKKHKTHSIFLDLPIGGIVLQLIYQGVFVGVIAVILFTICMPVIGPARTALFMALVPVFGTLLGALILDEVPGTIEFGGIVLVIFGMLAAMGMRLPRNKS